MTKPKEIQNPPIEHRNSPELLRAVCGFISKSADIQCFGGRVEQCDPDPRMSLGKNSAAGLLTRSVFLYTFPKTPSLSATELNDIFRPLQTLLPPSETTERRDFSSTRETFATIPARILEKPEYATLCDNQDFYIITFGGLTFTDVIGRVTYEPTLQLFPSARLTAPRQIEDSAQSQRRVAAPIFDILQKTIVTTYPSRGSAVEGFATKNEQMMHESTVQDVPPNIPLPRTIDFTFGELMNRLNTPIG
jgi:hypothetical protein